MYTGNKLAIAAIGVAAVQAAPLSRTNDVTISNISHWGSGCPQDTAIFSVKSSGNSIIANFGSFDVNFSSQAAETEVCGIAVEVASPAGWQFSAASTSYKDVIDVASGITASHLLTYTFSGSSDLATTRHDYVGPLKGTYESTDVVPAASRVWSKCGDAYSLLITNRGSVTDGSSTKTSGGPTSYFNVGTVSTNLEWRAC